MGITPRDSYVLTSPQGSTYDLASWSDLSNDGGPDFGDSWMVGHYTETPAADGGQFNFESVGVRTMRFPMLVASSNPAVGAPDLLETEQLIREAARPGATLDIDVAGDTTQNPIRFDILGGRWKPAYNVRHQAISVRQGTLELDTQPFGYMPTEILLASTASLGLPGALAIPGGSVLGDVPGLGNFYLQNVDVLPTTFPASSWRVDFLAWSLSARPSFSAFWRAASLTTQDISTASLAGDGFAPASQGKQLVPSQNLAAWKLAALADLPPAIEPAYRGRFRLYAWAKLGPSQALPWYVSADAAGFDRQSLASAAPIATLAPAVASGSPGGFGAQPSPAYTLLNLGELTLPVSGSGATAHDRVRLWISPATSNVGVATTTITFGGLYFQPLDGAAGVITKGIVVPTIGATTNYEVPYVRVDAIRSQVILHNVYQGADLQANYLGGFPLVGPSAVQLDLLIGERPLGLAATGPLIRAFNERNDGTVVSLTYRPRFAFVRGL